MNFAYERWMFLDSVFEYFEEYEGEITFLKEMDVPGRSRNVYFESDYPKTPM